MIRSTLQECINLFNSNEMMKYNAVRGMEQLGEWETAKIYWLKLGRQLDADACQLIIDSRIQADKIRNSII